MVEAAERRGARNVRVFGSVARGADTESSDVDLLVGLDGDVGLVALAGLARELEEMLGRKVDVVPASTLKAGLRSEALRKAIPLSVATSSGWPTSWPRSLRSLLTSLEEGTMA